MKNQRANLNTLPPRLTLRLRIHKRRMRHTPSPPIRLRIKTFNQRHQIRSLSIAIIPLDIRIRLHTISLTRPVRVNESDGNQIAVRDGMCVSNGQGIFENCLDRSPDVDDLVSPFQEFGCLVRKMVGDAVLGCRIGLIDVYALYGSAEGICRGAVFRGTANSVVEDEDFGCTGTGWIYSLAM